MCCCMIEAHIFRALADPTRRAVFERLSAAEMTVSDLTRGFSVSQPANSFSTVFRASTRSGQKVR